MHLLNSTIAATALLAFGACTAAAAIPAAAAPRYHATFVTGRDSLWPPTYGGINNAGQMIGNLYSSDGEGSSGFVTVGNRLQRFGPFNGYQTTAVGINNGGQVVGMAGPHAFVYDAGRMRGIGTLGGAWAKPAAINDAGQIVGLSATASGAPHAFLYTDGQMRDLSSVAPYGYEINPLDINNHGHITGAWNVPQEERHAFVYADDQWADIGTLGGSSSVGTHINDAGQVAGSAHVLNDLLKAAFLYTPGVGMRELARGTWMDPALPTGLNNSGTAVGIGIGFYPLFTFLANDAGTYYLESLLDASWSLSGAAFINDVGQISVTGCNGAGDCGLARLDPVPEPSTWLMLLGGLALLAWRRRLPWRSAGVLAMLGGTALPAAAAVAPHYTLTVYVPEEAQAYPSAMNGVGHLAGIWFKSSPWSDYGVPTPYLSTGDKWVDLGALQPRFRPTGINRHDEVAGTAGIGDLNRPRAFLYSGQQLHNLGTLGGRTSHANAINDSGQVVGASSPGVASGGEHAFIWQHNLMRDLGTPGGAGSTSDAIDINNRAQIAGNWAEEGGPTRAFLYENGDMQDLDTLGGDSASVTALSQAGHVLGVSAGPDGVEHNFVYYQGAMSALAPLETSPLGPFMRARDINSAGDAVGASFIWSGGVRYDLNALLAPEWSVRDAVAINDHGQIAAVGCLRGQCNAVVLAPVPEPATLGLMLAGLPVLSWMARRRRPGRARVAR